MDPIFEAEKTAKARAKDGCQLFYRIHPNPGKPRIVLIHSLALDTSVWNGVVRELRQDLEILTCDCRGHGQSDRRPGAYTVQQFADDLAAILDDCGWPSAAVAGCSMGGCVAEAFAAAYPKRAEALGLIDTTAWYGPTAVPDWNQRAAKAAESGFPGMIAFQVTRWFSDPFRAEHPDLVDAVSRVFLANDLACYEASCKMMGELDLRSALGSFRVPVSVIVGEEDYATPIAMSQSLQAAIPGATLHVIKTGRHLTPIQCPREIAGLLRELARKTRAAKGA
jgi:3-oxoadipate enol-lactonase